MPSEPHLVLGDYKTVKTLGKGAFSKVKLAVHVDTGTQVAIKIIDKQLMEKLQEKSKKYKEGVRAKQVKSENVKITLEGASLSETIASLQNEQRKRSIPEVPLPPLPKEGAKEGGLISSLQKEVQLLMRLQHPNIIKIYQVIDSDTECHIVMDYAKGGEMKDFLTAHEFFTEEKARYYFRQLVSAMDHSHNANIVHRDLKLENLLLDENKDLLITDFGMGTTFDPFSDTRLDSFCGTPTFAAPEVISGIPYVGAKSDVWSMGVILYYFTAGKLPFSGSTISILYRNIKEVNYRLMPYFSEELSDLLKQILVKEPEKRIDIEGIRNHPWVVKGEGPPIRITKDTRNLGSMISTIYYDTKSTVITLGSPNKPSNLQLFKKSEKPNHVKARRKSISVTPICTKETIQDKNRCSSAKPLNTYEKSPVEREIAALRRLSIVGPTEEDEPDLQAIQNWHRIHRPPKSIRTASILGSLISSNDLDPSTMFQDLHSSLLQLQSEIPLFSFTRQPDFYVFLCIYNTDPQLVFELEICKAFLSTAYSLQSKKIKGDLSTLKSLEARILSLLSDWN